MEHYEACLERGTSIKENFQYYTLGYAYTEWKHNEINKGKTKPKDTPLWISAIEGEEAYIKP